MDVPDPEELMVTSVVQYTQFILNMFVPRTGCLQLHCTRFFFPTSFFPYSYIVWVMSLILLTYKVTDVHVRLVCMHIIYLPIPTSFVAAVAVSPFPPPPGAHLKQVLEVKNCNTLSFRS